MFDVKLAVGAGYEFVIASSDDVRGVWLKRTEQVVSVNGATYPLYKGSEFEDSVAIDAIMDAPNHPQIYKIEPHLVN